MTDTYMTVRETAAYLGTGCDNVARLVREKRFKGIKRKVVSGRNTVFIPRESVEAMRIERKEAGR